MTHGQKNIKLCRGSFFNQNKFGKLVHLLVLLKKLLGCTVTWK